MDMCKSMVEESGKVVYFTNVEKEYITLDFIKPMEDAGLRTVAIAYRDLFVDNTITSQQLGKDSKSVQIVVETKVMQNLTCICIWGLKIR